MITKLYTDEQEKSNSINEDRYTDKKVLEQTDNEKTEDITVSNLQSNEYDYSELDEPIDHGQLIKHNTPIEHDTQIEHDDEYKDDHFEELSSVSNGVADVTHIVTNSAPISQSFASASYSIASVSHNDSKTALVSHNDSNSASVSHSDAKSASVTRSDAKSASVPNSCTNSASISHNVTNRASILHSDSNIVNEARDFSFDPINDANSNDGTSRLNELLDEYLNESFKEDENDEKSCDQHSIASSTCSEANNSSTTVSRGDDLTKNTFHATRGMHEGEEEEICEESIDEEISDEEIPEFVENICFTNSSENFSTNKISSENVLTNHSLEHLPTSHSSGSLSNNQGLVFSQRQLMLDVHVTQNKRDANIEPILKSGDELNYNKRFTNNLPPLTKSKSLLISVVKNDVDETEEVDDDVSFGDVDIDDLLDEIQPVERVKQQHKPININ